MIDDEEHIRDLCGDIVTSVGMEPHAAADGLVGMDVLRDLLPEYVLLDVNLPGRNGMDILKEIRGRFPKTRVVMITGEGSIDRAVAAMKLGAYDYIPKPFTPGRLREVLTQKGEDGPVRPPRIRSFCKLIGVSSAMQRVYTIIERAAKSDSTVLIEGDSGTGKELVARAIHVRSPRAKEPFVPVDCGAIAPSLIESELFGHVAGAYTDAKRSGIGLLRSAGAGYVFLDEIGELGTGVQVKLLRALQEMEVRPVGSSGMEAFRARVIAATNRDLSQEVSRGRFRHDLFYRLHVIPIFLPPLRERREDIPLLVEHFLRRYGEQAGREMGISVEALRRFMRYDWPGNVRELANVIQRAFALLDGDLIEPSGLSLLFPGQARKNGEERTAEAADARGDLLVAREAETIRQALNECGGNKRAAARNLGIGIATFYRKIKKYNITAPPRR